MVIVRNLSIVNGRAWRPGLRCRNNTGLPIRQRIASATASISGESTTMPIVAIAKSSVLLAARLIAFASKVFPRAAPLPA